MPPLSSPPAVLFDLDGTLIDTIELLLSSARYTFEGWHRRAPTEQEWIAGIGTPLVAQLRAYAETEDEVASLLARYRAYQHEHHDRLTRHYAGAPDLLTELARVGHPLGVVTSKSSAIARRSLAHVGLERFFQAIIGFDETTRHKPDPEPVFLALERLGVAPHKAVFVGDSPHDVRAGNAAGVVTIAALWGPFSRETLAAVHPNHFIESLAELPPILRRAFTS